MYTISHISTPALRFGDGSGSDKLRSLQQFGPFQPPPLARPPTIGFVFPDEYRDYANRLYRALRDGVGYFKGLPTVFGVQLEREHVFRINGFSLQERENVRAQAQAYADAVSRWIDSGAAKPDIVFVIHPRTSSDLEGSPYYETKTRLLLSGIVSQHVTTDVMDNSRQWEWSAANIALAAFVKLGGIPWILADEDRHQELVLGVGRADVTDPTTRLSTQTIGFTCCFSGAGTFNFVHLGRIASTASEYLNLLQEVVKTSTRKASRSAHQVDRMIFCLPKEARREEVHAVRSALSEVATELGEIDLVIVRINEGADQFVYDGSHAYGLPPKGLNVNIGDDHHLIYTEGREERQPWRNRLPATIRVRFQSGPHNELVKRQSLTTLFGLSQMNWKGFNAEAKPISTFYGHCIAQILSHVSPEVANRLSESSSNEALEHRLWFL